MNKTYLILIVVFLLLLVSSGLYLQDYFQKSPYSIPVPESYDTSHCKEGELCIPKEAQDKLFVKSERK